MTFSMNPEILIFLAARGRLPDAECLTGLFEATHFPPEKSGRFAPTRAGSRWSSS
jgi:hypothetical protein